MTKLWGIGMDGRFPQIKLLNLSVCGNATTINSLAMENIFD